MSPPITVLIVDDSALVRSALSGALSTDPGIEIMATAADPYQAVEVMKKGLPDVLILDIEMPRMDGLTFLRKVMAQRPIPVIICSTLAEKGAKATLEALEAGAVDIVTKPKMGTRAFFEESRITLCDAVKSAARVTPRPLRAPRGRPEPPARARRLKTTEKIVVLGASTGGTDALRVVLEGFPRDAPAVAIVQHMPAGFTQAFAERLDESLPLEVREARDGDPLLRGRVLIAPGDRHLLVRRDGARHVAELRDGPLVSRHRPSVDVLFRSAARAAGENVVAALLTGMGKDGARGMVDLVGAGASTVAQDEASCVVYGMPGAAVEAGGAREVLPLEAISGRLLDWAH
jgi:two-component system chemotaxis response regulator CheB